MPAIPFSRLADGFIYRLERLGATVLCSSKDKPIAARIVTGDGQTDCLVFLWTITPGGGPGGERPVNERRIQITPKGLRMPLLPGVRTLVGGWSEEVGVYAFWDPRRHTQFSQNSPSFQVSLDTLQKAHTMGLATHFRPSKEGAEVVVAVSEDSLLWYVQHGAALHNSDRDTEGVESLIEGTDVEERDFIDESKDEYQAGRRYELVETIRAFRDAKFRPEVLKAYRYSCTVCGSALKLVDAAHIVPVSWPDSNDEVTNGLALCRQHHGAYDSGLLGIRSDYRIITNPSRESVLAKLKLDMGLEAFKRGLPEFITPPSHPEIRPKPRNLFIGLQARQWPSDQVA